jgi:hypothetical protein
VYAYRSFATPDLRCLLLVVVRRLLSQPTANGPVVVQVDVTDAGNPRDRCRLRTVRPRACRKTFGQSLRTHRFAPSIGRHRSNLLGRANFSGRGDIRAQRSRWPTPLCCQNLGETPSLENRVTPLILATRVWAHTRATRLPAGCRDPLSREAVRLGACSSRGLFSRALGTLILPGHNLASRLTRSYIAASMMEGRFPDLAARDDI